MERAMKKNLYNDWQNHLADEFNKAYYTELLQTLKEEYKNKSIFPNQNDIFNSLNYTSYSNTKVVIIGQDPYHRPGQAHGLSFSVQPGTTIPPSLRNIFKELKDDLGCTLPNHGCLTSWAKQGVLLLNTVLTVRQGEPNSHKGIGWERFTDQVIKKLSEREEPVVFILWGRHAGNKQQYIDESRHFIISSPHPSPFSASRGFFGSRPFSKTNGYLTKLGNEEIDWQIPDL